MASLARLARAILFFLEVETLYRIPLGTSMSWLRILGRLRWWTSPATRRSERRKMGAFESGDRLPLRHLSHQLARRRLRYLILRRDARAERERLQVEGWERVEKMRAEGQGVVLLGAHVGHPPVVRWFLRTTEASVSYLVRQGFPREPEGAERWLEQRLRGRSELDSDALGGEDGFSLRYLKKARDQLAQGGMVFITADGPFGERSVRVPFREWEIDLRAGGLALALASGAAAVPCFGSFDLRGHFRVEFQERLTVEIDSDGADLLGELAEAYAKRLEAYVLGNPTNVFLRDYLLAPRQ